MTDPIALAARASADRLAPEHGPGLAAEVEAALYTHDHDQRPGQYLDPISLGTLIVAIATLAWTVYTDQRKKASACPHREAVARQVRIQLRQHAQTSPHDTSQITEIVVTELLQVADSLPPETDQGR